MRAAARDSAPCRTGRGLAASRRPFGDARSPVRHGAGAEHPPCHQAIQSKKEVLTFNRDLTHLHIYTLTHLHTCTLAAEGGKCENVEM